jgi:hypothetical protein
MEVPDWKPQIENAKAKKLVTPVDNGKFKFNTIGGVPCLKVCLDDIRKDKNGQDLRWTLESCFKALLENGCSIDSLDEEIKANSRAKKIVDELFANENEE